MTRVFLIAEVAQAHEGSLGIAHSFIDAVATTGFDCIKFQTHIAAAESSEYEQFRVKFSQQDTTRTEYWKRMEFSLPQWQELKRHAEERGLEFLSSPFSLAAVDLLESIGVRRYKVGSGEVTNDLMLDRIASTKKPVILSSGMSTYADIDRAVGIFNRVGSAVSVLQCTTKYPTAPQDIGLNVLAELRNRFGVPVGLSDHSGTIFPSLAAVSLGAVIIEVHVTFDRMMFGPDATSSLTIAELKQLATGVRFIETALASAIDKENAQSFESLKTLFGKSLAVARDLQQGHVLMLEDLIDKKPGDRGISASDFRAVLGKKLKSEKRANTFLVWDDLIQT